ncbi:MAG: hypothetical protein H8D23_21875 [Candidatus Brocadiales bacterium]|nr:hypothetical protein [Candidatus Brocadiales bacterium]
MKINKKVIRRLLGGTIFVFGATYTSNILGGEATRGIIIILAGIMLGAGVGIPKSWLGDDE